MPTKKPSSDNANETSPSLYLIKGDISGIQDFIFNVKSDGAAQSLKGRSFFIKILLEVSMQMIFDEYHINPEEISQAKISTSGGNFILKLPLDSTDGIKGIQFRISKALQYTGLNIMICAIGYQKDFKPTKECLNYKIRERKYQLLDCQNEEETLAFFKPVKREKLKQNKQ